MTIPSIAPDSTTHLSMRLTRFARPALLLLLAATIVSAEEAVFTGLPALRLDAAYDGTEKHELTEDGARKYVCRIVSKGKHFYWASRGNRELIRSISGDYTYYVSPDGAGYVKIFSGQGKPFPFDYMEQLSQELKTFTYWGKRASGPPEP